ncbi:MAG: type II secretion system protein [Planctomycetia bacterium]|nr:type II secretion system protein [Planctomycetia bacterium]
MQTRRGFTLVELLIVIVIIGLLAGITSVAFHGVRQSVKSSLISTEMSQLSMALDAYKNKFGEYPPDFSDQAAVEKHLRKRWPRYNGSEDYPDPVIDFNVRIRTAWNLLPDSDLSYISSLVIWLGGLPSADNPNKPGGFFLNPTDPFNSSTGQREETFFDFDPKYIKTNVNGAPAFCLNEFPVIYFRAAYGSGYIGKSFVFDNDGDISYAVPYAKAYDQAKNIVQWYDEERFQLVHPGLDGSFGSNDPTITRFVPTQTGVTSRDADNITNFVTSGTLESLYE